MFFSRARHSIEKGKSIKHNKSQIIIMILIGEVAAPGSQCSDGRFIHPSNESRRLSSRTHKEVKQNVDGLEALAPLKQTYQITANQFNTFANRKWADREAQWGFANIHASEWVTVQGNGKNITSDKRACVGDFYQTTNKVFYSHSTTLPSSSRHRRRAHITKMDPTTQQLSFITKVDEEEENVVNR